MLLDMQSDKSLIEGTFFSSLREVLQTSPKAKMLSFTPGAVGFSFGLVYDI
jgi:hypothetical protein